MRLRNGGNYAEIHQKYAMGNLLMRVTVTVTRTVATLRPTAPGGPGTVSLARPRGNLNVAPDDRRQCRCCEPPAVTIWDLGSCYIAGTSAI